MLTCIGLFPCRWPLSRRKEEDLLDGLGQVGVRGSWISGASEYCRLVDVHSLYISIGTPHFPEVDSNMDVYDASFSPPPYLTNLDVRKIWDTGYGIGLSRCKCLWLLVCYTLYSLLSILRPRMVQGFSACSSVVHREPSEHRPTLATNPRPTHSAAIPLNSAHPHTCRGR